MGKSQITINYWLAPGFDHLPPWRNNEGTPRGSPLRPFRRVLLCPRNIPKLRSCMGLVVVWIWASLIIVVLFLFGSMSVACWVRAGNRSANFAACSATRCYKKPELLGWDLPPHRPANKQHSFQYTVISHIKSCMAHSGPRQKARLFVTEGIMAKKAQIQQARPLRMLVEWASIFISYIPASFHLMDTEP